MVIGSLTRSIQISADLISSGSNRRLLTRSGTWEGAKLFENSKINKRSCWSNTKDASSFIGRWERRLTVDQSQAEQLGFCPKLIALFIFKGRSDDWKRTNGFYQIKLSLPPPFPLIATSTCHPSPHLLPLPLPARVYSCLFNIDKLQIVLLPADQQARRSIPFLFLFLTLWYWKNIETRFYCYKKKKYHLNINQDLLILNASSSISIILLWFNSVFWADIFLLLLKTNRNWKLTSKIPWSVAGCSAERTGT